jgi:uncharacterized protein YkwD
VSWKDRTRRTATALLMIGGALQVAAQVAPRTYRQPHTIAEQYLFQSINAERSAAGLPALYWSQPLTGAAQYHAFRMRVAGAIAHQFSGEPDVVARASQYGARFSRVAENVATSPSVLEMHTALMHSPHHRENILDPRVNAVGISVVTAGHQLWAVEDFAGDVQDLSLEQQEQQVGQILADTGVPHVTRSQEARATCAMPSGFVGNRPAFVMRYTASDLNRLPSQLTARLAQGGVSGAAVGACASSAHSDFASYNIAVVLYR